MSRSATAPSRVPPHDLQAEQSLLGAMMLDHEAILATAGVVSAGDFYKPAHAYIFNAIHHLFVADQPVDPVTVADELTRERQLDAVGGHPALVKIMESTPATTAAPGYVRIVSEHAARRRLISVAGGLTELGYNPASDISEAFGRAETLLREANRGQLQPGEALRTALLTSDQVKALLPPDLLIDGLLMRDSLALVYGPPGAGKTFLALDWALHVATGSWWNGKEVHRGPVLYVVAEGVAGIGRRIDAWQQHHRVYNLDRHDPVLWLPQRVNLFDRGEVDALRRVVADVEPVLVVFDTLHRCTVGVDENSARDMGIVIEHMDLLRRDSGACVLAVHHSGKELAQGSRGSSALRGDVHTEIEASGDELLTVKVTKQKDSAEPGPIRLRRIVAEDSCVLVPTGSVATTDNLTPGDYDTLDALRSVMVPGGVPDGTWKTAAIQTCASSTYYLRRAKLIRLGMVDNLGTDTRPRYVLTDESDQALDVAPAQDPRSPL